MAAKNTYDNFFKEYIALKHMSVADSEVKYILPHHAVYKPFSSSSKVRAVFDGSSVDNLNTSLNSKLCIGPKLQKDLPQIIDLFRSHNIALCCDIEKMYRNISLAAEDRKYQHIFFRSSPNEPIVEYELNTVTYGLTDSPFKALRCIQQLSNDSKTSHPLASYALQHETYVDDVISGHQDLTSANQLKQELIQVLGSASFNVKKWSSNSPELLSTINSQDQEKPILFSADTVGIKILGLIWNPTSDEFSYQIHPFEGIITKRTILSYIARIYDCMGYLGPTVLKAKQFMQQLWLLGISWDEQVPQSLHSQWRTFTDEFPLLSKIKIPRKLFFQNATFRILGFSDASQHGIGCCVYLHVTTDDTSQCFLLRSKTKVTPLRSQTIPRLELISSLLLTKLVKSMVFPYEVKEIIYFTDSKIVLAWIHTSPHLLNTFVSNRVVQILKTTSPDQWRHCRSEDNCADVASRGLKPSELLTCKMWWHGPSFVNRPIQDWPQNQLTTNPEDLPEMKKEKTILITTQSTFLDIIESHNSFISLQRTIGWILRFIHNCKHQERIKGPLTVQELNTARLTCARITQQHYFKEELILLQANKKLSKPLQKLSPFIDDNGIIRVGGRLKHSALPYNSRHPILLPKRSKLTNLICSYYHVYSYHSGTATVTSLIHKHWWIIHLRSTLRNVIFKCFSCTRLSSKPLQPSRVASIHPGPDGVVRVATIKTLNGTYVRPVNRLVPLPMESN